MAPWAEVIRAAGGAHDESALHSVEAPSDRQGYSLDRSQLSPFAQIDAVTAVASHVPTTRNYCLAGQASPWTGLCGALGSRTRPTAGAGPRHRRRACPGRTGWTGVGQGDATRGVMFGSAARAAGPFSRPSAPEKRDCDFRPIQYPRQVCPQVGREVIQEGGRLRLVDVGQYLDRLPDLVGRSWAIQPPEESGSQGCCDARLARQVSPRKARVRRGGH